MRDVRDETSLLVPSWRRSDRLAIPLDPRSGLSIARLTNQGREQELHDRFRASHSHGEWFHLTPDLNAFIDAAAAEHGDLDAHFGLPVNLLREAMSSVLSEEFVRV